jgi:hypothetical protein
MPNKRNCNERNVYTRFSITLIVPRHNKQYPPVLFIFIWVCILQNISLDGEVGILINYVSDVCACIGGYVTILFSDLWKHWRFLIEEESFLIVKGAELAS